MKRKAYLFLTILLLATVLTGCWSRRELNDLGIAVGMGIDKAGNEYEVSVQIVDPGEVSPKKGGASGRAPVTLYSAKGGTVADAVRRLVAAAPRRTYFSHVRIFLLSEDLAREGIIKLLDFISRDHEFRTDFFIAIVKDTTAKNILSEMSHLEKLPAQKMFDDLEVGEKEWSPVVAIQLDELTNSFVSKGRHAILSGFRLVGNKEVGKTRKDIESVKPLSKIETSGLGVFKEDRLVGWLNEPESRGYVNLTNKLKRSVIETSCPEGGKLTVNVIRSKTEVKGLVEKGKPKIKALMRTEADVSDVECKIDLTKNETITNLQKDIAKQINEHVEASIKKAKRLKSDIFGFGEAIHRANPAYWNKVKDDWDNQFPDLPVEFKVELQIRRLGTIGDSLLNKLKD